MKNTLKFGSALALVAAAVAANAQVNYAFGYSGYTDTYLNLTFSDGTSAQFDTATAQLGNYKYNQGWYDLYQTNSPYNDNYLAGQIYGDNYNDYFSFNLGGLDTTKTITGLSMTVYSNAISSNGVYKMHDVSTDPWTLNQNTNSLAIYSDLGSGAGYGSAGLTTGQSWQWLTFNMNANAISDLYRENDSTGYFSVGGSFSSAVPGPESAAAMGIALIGALRRRARRA